MDIEKTEALPLTKAQALNYAKFVVGEQLGKSAVKVRYMGGGSFGRAVSVRCKDGKTLAVKFLRAKGMMQKEAHDLKLLARHCTVKVPRVFFTRLSDQKIPVDCYGMELGTVTGWSLSRARARSLRPGCSFSAKNAGWSLPIV